MQAPAHFVVLARQLRIAAHYDARRTNASQASVTDRLRKQIKVFIAKV